MSSFRENLGIKITSLFVALMLWLHVATERITTTVATVPVSVVGVQPDLVLVEMSHTEWQLQVEGTGKEILKRPLRNCWLILDASGIGAGHHSFATQLSVIQSPGGAPEGELRAVLPAEPGLPIPVSVPDQPILASIRTVAPPVFEVVLEERAERRVPVRVVLGPHDLGGAAVLGRPAARPPELGISGPRSAVEQVEAVVLEPISVRWSEERRGWIFSGCRSFLDATPADHFVPFPAESRDTTVVFPVAVDLDSLCAHCDVEQRVVGVEQRIAPVVTRVLTDVPVVFTHVPPGLELSVNEDRITLTLSGPKAAVEAIDPDSLRAVVDLTPFQEGGVFNVAAELPFLGEVELKSAVPRKFKVTLTPKGSRGGAMGKE